MSDKSEQSQGGYDANDPWAAPQHEEPRGTPPSGPRPPSQFQPPAGPLSPFQPPAPVHDQPTVSAMPGPVPAAPTAPGGPAQPAPGPYGYPGVPPAPAAQLPQGPAAPYGAGYGYPAYPGYGQSGWGEPAYGRPGWQPQPANGLGVAAMVLGILSVCLFCLYGVVGIVLGVLALIFGIMGRKRARQGTATNSGQALAGIILGAIGIAIGAIVVALLAWGVSKAWNDDKTIQDDTNGDYATSLVTGAGR
jgi:hypothetical protein